MGYSGRIHVSTVTFNGKYRRRFESMCLTIGLTIVSYRCIP